MLLPRIGYCVVVMSAWLLAGMPIAHAGGLEESGPAAHIDAEALINECTNRFKGELDSGVTSRMRAGSADIIDCLNTAILDQMRATMPEPDKAVERFREYLKQLSYAHQRIWWEFYNENKSCREMRCGTMMHVFHLGHHMALLEDMLRDVTRHRQQEGF